MRLTKHIILFTVLILTISVKNSSAETTCTENELGDQTCVTTTTTNVPGVTTNNLLSQDFTDGSWSDNGTNQLLNLHGYDTVAGVDGGTVESTISLNDTLTKEQINTGFSSTLGADIWFWYDTTQSVTMRQTLTDDNGNSITQSRTINKILNGYQTYTDTIIVSENSQQDYSIKSEFNFSVPGYPSGHYGADLKSPTLNVTTNDYTTTSTSETFTYCYDRVPNACTYDNEALEEISDFKTDDGKSYDQYVEDAIKDFEVVSVDTSIIVEDDFGKIEEFKIEDYAVKTFNDFIEANDLTETFETALIEEDLSKEEFFDTMTDSIKEEFGDDFDMGGDEFKEDLTTEGGPSDITENTVEVKEEETVETETDTTDIKESNDTTTETEVEENTNETNTESETSENVSSKSDVDKNTETEGTETETNNEEAVETTADTDVDADSGTSVDTRSIEKKVERVIAKVLKKLKQVDQKLQAVQFITTQGIKSGEADISGYINKRIYGSNQKLNDPLADDFLQKINILEQQQIYKDASLVAYESNDPIAVKQRQMVEVEQEINSIQAELYALKEKRENYDRQN